ncbi:MAG: DNA-binding protein [Deltaproteobacteria bacterium GWA2_38_16]|nr:MAG: DNA-binding protein [Deltaproteobacteria bacterium GWA2_38_16]
MTKINVKGTEITIINVENEDYISITDMLKAKDGDFFISDWLRNRNTVEFLGIWEHLNNPNFNYGEYATIRSKAGLHNYKISVKEWVEKTNAIGLKATAGRYGGTYAHKDIAFEFGMWISAEFKIYLIKEFQRLKEQEQKQLGWDIKRNLAKINYRIHTDAIFGMTAKEWRDYNKDKSGNIRDYANVSQLVCLSNLENLNALFINENLPQDKRLIKLNQIAIQQMRLLSEDKNVKRLESKGTK